ncbi:hypothetical protein H5410_032706 [Solanum commersonii]|uniref:Uncharacterized protein n=1 Tax=Solanum commersonii TaxID=4109 RepID=A0A9J5YNP7_SOLCO|nr:hypothetical protein H5410_032706 [Solanum commersonii]
MEVPSPNHCTTPKGEIEMGPSMKSPMFIGESQNGLYVLKNRLPVAFSFKNSSCSSHSFKDVSSSLSCISSNDVKSRLCHVRLGHIPLLNI